MVPLNANPCIYTYVNVYMWVYPWRYDICTYGLFSDEEVGEQQRGSKRSQRTSQWGLILFVPLDSRFDVFSQLLADTNNFLHDKPKDV